MHCTTKVIADARWRRMVKLYVHSFESFLFLKLFICLCLDACLILMSDVFHGITARSVLKSFVLRKRCYTCNSGILQLFLAGNSFLYINHNYKSYLLLSAIYLIFITIFICQMYVYHLLLTIRNMTFFLTSLSDFSR